MFVFGRNYLTYPGIIVVLADPEIIDNLRAAETRSTGSPKRPECKTYTVLHMSG